MRALRAAWGVPVGLPATKWMAELGAFALRSDTELLLKSRRVVPGRLLEAGFTFDHAQWPEAADDLVRRVRGVASPGEPSAPADRQRSRRFAFPARTNKLALHHHATLDGNCSPGVNPSGLLLPPRW